MSQRLHTKHVWVCAHNLSRRQPVLGNWNDFTTPAHTSTPIWWRPHSQTDLGIFHHQQTCSSTKAAAPGTLCVVARVPCTNEARVLHIREQRWCCCVVTVFVIFL